MNLVGLYVDGDLPQEARRRVESHLMGCSTCAWEVQTLLITQSRLRDSGDDVVASDAFRARVLSALIVDNPHVAPVESPTEEPTQYQLPIRV